MTDELEDLAKEIRDLDAFTLIISDHGMKAVGRYGDHTENGFYSSNRRLNLKVPEITDFYNILSRMRNEST